MESARMPVLPVIDLMLVSGWTALLIAFLLKLADLVTRGSQTIFSLTPGDFLLFSVVCFLFAIALAARTWVASQAPSRSAARRRRETLAAYHALQNGNGTAVASEEGAPGMARDETAPTPAPSRAS
jgi:hypothetical protein